MSMERTAGDASTSNYSAIKLGLQGLRNDEVTEDSIVTETDLNTLNTGKVMAAMIKKGDLPAQSNAEGGTSGKANATKLINEGDVIDEEGEDEVEQNNPSQLESQRKSIMSTMQR